jgi:hypothetical protein
MVVQIQIEPSSYLNFIAQTIRRHLLKVGCIRCGLIKCERST